MLLRPLPLLLLLLVLPGVGCAAPETVDVATLPTPPPDFSVDVTVLTGAEPGAKGAARRRTESQRLVLFADGSLHTGRRPDLGANWLPGLTRVLDPAQVEALWSFAQGLGLTDPAVADPLVNFNRYRPDTGQTIYLVALTGAGRRWNFIATAALDETIDAGPRLLVRRMAELGWDSGPVPERAVQPRRYDFGPDPYARFR